MTEYKSLDDVLIHLKYCLQSSLKRDDAYIIISDLVVQPGWDLDYDKNWCYQHQVPIKYIDRPGGTLVFCPGDFAYGHYGNDAQKFAKQWREFLVQKLQIYGLNPQINNNDILIDNNKITGTVIIDNKMALGLISINPQLNVIQQVCQKPNTHILQGLKVYGIDAEIVTQWFKEFQKLY